LTLLLVLFVGRAWWSYPFEVAGFGGTPEQPIAFPHTVHAGTDILVDTDGNAKLDASGEPLHGLGLDCTFCHSNVDKGATASIPPVEQCVFCHKTVGTELPEVMKLIAAWDNKEAVVWERVHRLPDHVRFVHEAHIRYFSESEGIQPSQVCQKCHGDVGKMEKVRQVETLKMGDCVSCHKENAAPTDCTTCHY